MTLIDLPATSSHRDAQPISDAGDRDAAGQLADLLARRGDLDELRARADADDRDAAERLADLLAQTSGSR